MALFDLPQRATRKDDKQIAKKSTTSAKAVKTVRQDNSLMGRIESIKLMVEQSLGQYKDEYIVINQEEVLHDYITECIGNGYIALDTETDGLDPLQNTLAGICPYTRGQKGAYIPLNHISYVTGEKSSGQLSMDFVMSEFKRLLAKRPEIDMFNAPFDIRFLRANGLHDIYCTWDGYLGARLMNENEPTNALKLLHNKYCLGGKGDAFKFDDLFKGIPFTKIPYNVGYLYAAHDPVITSEYCDFQRPYLTYDKTQKPSGNNYMNGVASVFKNIEMPLINVICDMEDTGVKLDLDYADKLSVEYHDKLEESKQKCYDACDHYRAEIENYKRTHADSKLDDPINISSPTQLAILFYDILKIEPPDPKKPRGTGEDILVKIDNDIARAILEFRGIDKLINTYIDKLPNCVNPKDGRVHCKFNQYGADTGRMSSSDPNLQNIPSHNKDIRKMFVASDGYVLMSSDYSQQEPKALAALCKQDGDSQMYDTFMQGKDLYSEIASKAFNVPYEDCKEFRPDGTTNKEGKARRTQAKSILLGALYGRGVESIAEQLKCSTDDAQQIKDSVFRGFPAIKRFEDESKNMCAELGFVTTIAGRKRRLPDYSLSRYDFKWENGVSPYDDPLDFDNINSDIGVPYDRQDYYLAKLNKKINFQARQKIFEEANKENIWIVDNFKKISQAERQIVNSRIQGSAADLTKLAMIELNNHARLKELGFRLLIPVHDEVIAECPEENVKECSELLATVMSSAAERLLQMPIKCDVEITKAWYGETIDGNEIKQKESNTSHGMDVDNLRGIT